jgi:hypothetical protein
MQMIGCDLHARQQTLAILDCETGEIAERVLDHEGDEVREFYSALEGPVRVGIEATGSMQWFLQLMEELGIECQVGHPAKVAQDYWRNRQAHQRELTQAALATIATALPQKTGQAHALTIQTLAQSSDLLKPATAAQMRAQLVSVWHVSVHPPNISSATCGPR